jgi:hypothetical protein
VWRRRDDEEEYEGMIWSCEGDVRRETKHVKDGGWLYI